MSGSVLTQVSETQRQKATTVNENFTAVQVAALFGRKAPGISGLTWAYFGGMLFVAGVATAIADGTVALTNTATNYVEATTAGVVSANTSGFTSGRIPLYTVTTAGGVITGYTDYRAPNSVGDLTIAGTIAVGNGSAAAPSITFASDTDTGIFRQAANSVGIAGNGVEIARFIGVASATRGFTFTNSNGGNPTIDVTAGSLAITPAMTLAASLAVATTLTVGGGTLTSSYIAGVIGTGSTVSGNIKAIAEILQDRTTYRGMFFGYDSANQTGVIGADSAGAASKLSIYAYTGAAWAEAASFTTAAAVLPGTLGVTGVIGAINGVALNPWSLAAGTSGAQIHDHGAIWADVNSVYYASNQYNNAVEKYAKSNGANRMHLDAAVNAIRFSTAVAGTAGNAITWLEQVRITHTASATRYVTITGSNGGNPAIGTSAGDLSITAANIIFDNTFGITSKDAGGAQRNVLKLDGSNVLTLDAEGTGALIAFVTVGTERARLTNAGYSKHSSSGTYNSATGAFHEFIANQNGSALPVIRIENAAATATNQNGVQVYLDGDPNNTGNFFFQGVGNAIERATLRSNGGLANFSANNVNLSTLIVKRDARKYTVAELEAFGQALERVDWGVWKYKDQTHDDFNHGPSVEGVREAFGGVKAAAWALPSLIDLFDEEKGLEGLVTHDLANIAFASLIHSNKQLRGEIAALRKSIH